MTTLLTITHTLEDGTLTSRNIFLDDGTGWTDAVLSARQQALGQKGLVGAQLYRFSEGHVGVCKVFQPAELNLV